MGLGEPQTAVLGRVLLILAINLDDEVVARKGVAILFMQEIVVARVAGGRGGAPRAGRKGSHVWTDRWGETPNGHTACDI